jgi:hypothetical protein
MRSARASVHIRSRDASPLAPLLRGDLWNLLILALGLLHGLGL